MVDANKLATFIDVAILFKKNSKCVSHKVAALIIDKNKGNIVSIGYNGTPKGFVNCDQLFKKKEIDSSGIKQVQYFTKQLKSEGSVSPEWIKVDKDRFNKQHHDFSEQYEIHAEQNALLKLIGTNCEPDNLCIITTLEPCYQCCKLIIASEVKEVVYIDKYERNEFNAEQFLSEFGIHCWQYN